MRRIVIADFEGIWTGHDDFRPVLKKELMVNLTKGLKKSQIIEAFPPLVESFKEVGKIMAFNEAVSGTLQGMRS